MTINIVTSLCNSNYYAARMARIAGLPGDDPGAAIRAALAATPDQPFRWRPKSEVPGSIAHWIDVERQRYRAWRAAQEPARRLRQIAKRLDGMRPYITDRGLRLADAGPDDVAEAAEYLARTHRDVNARQRRELGIPATPDDLRREDPTWWRRRLRREAGWARAGLAAAMRTIGGRTGRDYSDDLQVAHWRARQSAQAKWLAAHEMEADDGRKMPLSKLAESTRKSQTARAYAMTLGLQQLMNERKWIPVFITATLPPDYHPAPSRGKCNWTGQHLRQAVEDLQARWAHLRARIHRQGIRPKGIWTREPHKDGTPHLHALLWLPNEQAIATLQSALRSYFPGPHATRIKRLDDGTAQPASYVYKYLCKSLHGMDNHTSATDGDEDGDHLAQYDRVRAWASDLGTRRWGFVGVNGLMTIWQKLYAWKEPPADASQAMKSCWRMLRAHRWADALALLLSGVIGLDYEPRKNRYGETVYRPGHLIDRTTGEVTPRPVTWTIMKARTLDDSYPRPSAVADGNFGLPAEWAAQNDDVRDSFWDKMIQRELATGIAAGQAIANDNLLSALGFSAFSAA